MQHRKEIEEEMRRQGKGRNPPPHVVMDKLLDMKKLAEKTEFPQVDPIMSRFSIKHRQMESSNS